MAGKDKETYVADPSSLSKLEDEIIEQLRNAVGAAAAGAGAGININNLNITLPKSVVSEKETFGYCCYAADPRAQRGGGFKCASCGRKLKQAPPPKPVRYKFEP